MQDEDRDGIAGILLAHRDRLIRFLEAQGAGDEAEDLFQLLWMKLSERPTGPIAQPLSYLYRAASNLMLDRYRARRQGAQRERAWSDATGHGDAHAPSAEHALILREQLARAEAALRALGPRVETCFRRFRLDGIGQKAIAAELGVSLSTVESDLRRAYGVLVELRRQYDDV